MKHIVRFLSLVILISCNEKIVEQPENLIAKDKMVLILKDMAIVHAARNSNLQLLKDNGIEPTNYVFQKYKVDSLQFVESDKYYASLPLMYERIYEEVEGLLIEEKQKAKELKKINDSLKLAEKKAKDVVKKKPIKLPVRAKSDRQ